MPHINSTNFGSITIDGKKYKQVLIVGDSVKEREYNRLKSTIGTSHKIGDWEKEELLSNSPDLIIVGTGQSGVLTVDSDLKETAKRNGIKLIEKLTPKAIKIYNEKHEAGKKVNALFHTTC